VSRGLKLAGASTEGVSQTFGLVSRILVCLIGLLLAVIPWTERYCMLDNFPMGQDFELNLLAFLALLCLILLLAHSSKQGLRALFAVRCWLSSMIRSALRMTRHALRGHTVTLFHTPPLPSPSLGVYNLPLQI
jgi:hypothetical protein